MDDKSYQVRISGRHRIVLPLSVCDQLNVEVGDTLLLRIEAGNLRLQPAAAMIDHFRKKLRRKIGTDRSLVDELIAERTAAAARE